MIYASKLKKAKALRRSARYDEAAAVLKKLPVNNPRIATEIAEIALAREDWPTAISALTCVVDDNANATKARVKLARAKAASGDVDGAFNELDFAARHDPYDGNVVSTLCQLSQRAQRFGPSIRHLRRISPNIESVPNELIEKTIEFGYISWPFTIRDFILDKDVLDVGCGSGVHGLSFIMAGAKSYTGLDPLIDFESQKVKHKARRYWTDFGFAARDIVNIVPGVELIAGVFEDVAPDRAFDVSAMHYATEHFHRIEEIFGGISSRLRNGGKVVYRHHNYFAWNGHHMQPKLISNINPHDERQKKYMDWEHLRFIVEQDQAVDKKVNKISIEDLRNLTERYFDIEVWDRIPSNRCEGAGRLTPEIAQRWKEYKEADLTTQSIYCVGRKR